MKALEDKLREAHEATFDVDGWLRPGRTVAGYGADCARIALEHAAEVADEAWEDHQLLVDNVRTLAAKLGGGS